MRAAPGAKKASQNSLNRAPRGARGLPRAAPCPYTSAMSRFWKALLLCLALAGLPLQGIAAVTMSFCKHGAADLPEQAQASHAQHGDSHPGHAQAGDAEQLCADCTPCHLCSAFALPAANAVVVQEPASDFLTALALQPDGYLPDQPKRPPLA